MRPGLSLVLALTLVSATRADGLTLLPASATLDGREARQTLLAVTQDTAGVATAAHVSGVAWASSAPGVARVSAEGVVTPVGDGEAVVRATVGGKVAQATIRVRNAAPPAAWTFRRHVQPVLTRAGCNSGACHGALAGKGGFKLSLRAYDDAADHFAITRQAQARRADLQSPADSLLVLKGTRTVPHGGGTKIERDSREHRVLRDWIAAGAPAADAKEAPLVGLEVLPKAMLGTPGAAFRVTVRALYGDGTGEDVTEWARFGSSADAVATADEDGAVTVAGHGEAAITVGYGTQVATVSVRSPFPNAIAAEAFEKSPRHNFIDTHVLAKLRELNLPPSPQCDDRTFIRRLFLDAAGILPTPAEVEAFVADARPDKRDRLIDAVLARPEYTDYWTYKWSDLLLVSTRKLPGQAMWAFHRSVRRAVADNRPWDRFARDVLTATGSTLDRGEGNFFVLHTDVAELTEATAVTFLGMSITCARCHNHPLEKWTQDQYWGLANLFSRVAMKNGPRTGEVLVLPGTLGDALHPRKNVPIPPTPLDGLPLAEGAARDRRAYFADWLTDAKNPFFAKAVVNRVWQNYMGRGLVEGVDDLRDTNPPSNGPLLDALAADFRASGYDLRHLARVILRSAAYQRSSAALPANSADDRFHSRYLPRRLSAEVVLDAYSAVTGVPTPFTHQYNGVENNLVATPQYPLGMRALELPDSRVASPFLDAFGRPEREQVCSCERESDPSVGQALHLNNGKTLNDKLRADAGRPATWAADGRPPEEQLRELFRLALSRDPTARERAAYLETLAAAKDAAGRREALEDAFWGVMAGREFLFNH